MSRRLHERLPAADLREIDPTIAGDKQLRAYPV